jgi:hypothetical protein
VSRRVTLKLFLTIGFCINDNNNPTSTNSSAQILPEFAISEKIYYALKLFFITHVSCVYAAAIA